MDRVWEPIETVPTDDRKFIAGYWEGKRILDEEDNYKQIGWRDEPVWVQAVTHNHNPDGPNKTPGWNHKGGPFNCRPTHWSDLMEPPEQPFPVLNRKK